MHQISRWGGYSGFLKGEQVHQPAEQERAEDHDQEEKQPVFEARFFLASPEQGQDHGDQSRVKDHGQQVALKDHFFFPEAMSKASRAMR